MTSSCCDPRHDDGDNAHRRLTYGWILEAFPRLGRAPTLDEISKDLQVGENVIMDNLQALEVDGALRLDSASGGILDAYPYSAIPTKHIVQLEDGPKLYCMCAIDVFYVPFLTESDLSIDSRCHYCDSGIHIRVKGDAITEAEPLTTVVWDSAATYDCPLTNFFCSKEHLQLWLMGTPEESGRLLDISKALGRGKVAAARIRRQLAQPQPVEPCSID